MANKVKGEIALSYEGRAYTFRLDFNALADFEAATGENALKVLEGGDLTLTQMRALFHAGLQSHHPEVTLRDAGLILQSNMGLFGEAMAAAFPDAVPAGNVKAAKRAPRK